MKKYKWMIIAGVVLILASIGCTVWGAYRLIYIIKTDPFEDTPKYVLKVFGLVGIIFLQIFGYGGGITLIVLGCIFGGKAERREANKNKEQPKVVKEIPEERATECNNAYEDIKINGNELILKDQNIDMKTISNVFMNRNEVRIKIENKEFIINCKDSSEAISLVSKIKQHSK